VRRAPLRCRSPFAAPAQSTVRGFPSWPCSNCQGAHVEPLRTSGHTPACVDQSCMQNNTSRKMAGPPIGACHEPPWPPRAVPHDPLCLKHDLSSGFPNPSHERRATGRSCPRASGIE
jgi:hypothetical protein